jgi:hypothetical protein
MPKTLDFVKFEKKWRGKIVRPKGNFYKIPIKNYTVTAALYKFDDDITIFAIMAEDYNINTNKHWFTLYLRPEDLKHLEDFEILE